MIRQVMAVLVVLLTLFLSSCSTGGSTSGTSGSEVENEVNLDVRGHHYYMVGQFDSASAVYQRLLKVDPENTIALRDLGNLHFELAMKDTDKKSPSRLQHLRASRRYFGELEGLGEHDLELYDRLCETSLALQDSKSFLTYAKRSVDRYPFGRQYYNLGLAYYEVGDYQSAIHTQKEAIGRFQTSLYLTSFYRQLGRAYMKVDRDQTAERTLEEGLKIVNRRLEETTSPDEFRHYRDDKVGILLSLKRLYLTYHKDGKLGEVERQLQEAGYRAQE
jgi:tetratricopeptide (TPR) repeat protein